MPCTVVIMQPTFLPWLGYFELMARADKFIFLDTVQFEKQSWQSRNRLKSVQGEPFWLTVPLAAHELNTPIHQIRLASNWKQWRKKHLGSIRTNLGAAPFFKEIFPRVAAWLETDFELLAELNIAGVRLLAEMFSLSTDFFRTSHMTLAGTRTELLVNLCRQFGATRYYSPLGSKEYMEEDLFAANQIELVYQTWPHPVYSQRGGPFVSHLSALDALMNIGPAAARELLFQHGN
jgi:WbqC-like protein family